LEDRSASKVSNASRIIKNDTTGGLDTEGEGGDVEEEEILGLFRGVIGENGGLDNGM
jgi:hypothetical protein